MVAIVGRLVLGAALILPANGDAAVAAAGHAGAITGIARLWTVLVASAIAVRAGAAGAVTLGRVEGTGTGRRSLRLARTRANARFFWLRAVAAGAIGTAALRRAAVTAGTGA